MVLKSKIIANLQKQEFRFAEDSENSQQLNYNIDEVKINYLEIFKDGLLGVILLKDQLILADLTL